MPDYKTKGFLGRVIRRIRRDLREPEINPEFTDDEILELYLIPGWKGLFEDLVSFSTSPPVAKMDLSVVKNQEFYTLPPNVHQVLFLGKIDTQGAYTADFMPRDRLNPYGPGWTLNGTTLQINPYPQSSETLQLLYVPSGDIELHEGAGVVPVGETNQFKLAAAPSFGDLDTRDNAYAGCTVRVQDQDAGLTRIYEYQVDSYDPTTRICTTRQAIDSAVSTAGAEGSGTVDYQIIPPFGAAWFEVLAMRVSLMLLASRKEPKDYALMQRQYKTQLKGMRAHATMVQARAAPHYTRDRMGAGGFEIGTLLGG